MPGKNLAVVGGRTLLARAIDTASRSGLFGEIVVSSDDDTVLTEAATQGATADRRPTRLATDETRIIEVVREFIARRGLDAEQVMGILLPTAPMTEVADLRAAHDLFLANNGDVPVVSVAPFERPIEMAQVVNDRNRLVPVFREAYLRTTRSQEHEPSYWYNGAIIVNCAGRLATQRTLIGDEPIPYVMPIERSVDVDHEFQLALAEALLTRGPKA